MNNNIIDVKHIKKCFLMSRKAEPLPPLGTILGNIGVNSVKFCDEFNNYTKELPTYFLLQATILIYDNRSFSFSVKGPTTSFLLNLLKFEKNIKIKVHDRVHDKVISCIFLKDLIKLALFKFPDLKIDKSILII